MLHVHVAADFNFTNQTLTFSSGDTIGAEQCGLIEITDDDIVENDETFGVSFTTSDPVVEFSSGLQPLTTVNITDDDGKSYILPLYMGLSGGGVKNQRFSCGSMPIDPL